MNDTFRYLVENDVIFSRLAKQYTDGRNGFFATFEKYAELAHKRIVELEGRLIDDAINKGSVAFVMDHPSQNKCETCDTYSRTCCESCIDGSNYKKIGPAAQPAEKAGIDE